MWQFKNKCSGLKIDWGSAPAAAIYRMRITSLHFVVLHKFFVDSAYKQLKMALSQTHNLLRRNNLTGGLTSSLLPFSFISIYFLAPDEDNFLSKALVFHFPCVSLYR